MRFRFFSRFHNRIFKPHEITVTFEDESFSVSIRAHDSITVLSEALGDLSQSSGMLDKNGVEGFDGDILYTPRFKKDGKTKNGGVYTELKYSVENAGWNMRSLEKGVIVGNRWKTPMK